MKKILSGLTALLLLLSVCTGCGNNGDSAGTPAANDDGAKGIYFDLTGIEPQETVLEYGGNTVPAEMYFYLMSSYCSDLASQLYMFSSYYGMYTELVGEDGSIVWDGNLDGTTPRQYVLDNTEGNALFYMLLENMAAEHGVTLTDEDRADMEATLAQQIEAAGGGEVFQESLTEMGISRETFDRVIFSAGYLLEHLQELAADPSSDLYEAPSDDNAYVDHILLMTVDSTTREPLSDEEVQAKRQQAEDILAQLQAADDVEALFNELVAEYGEDQGRVENSGYLVDPETNFVPEFLEATFALQPGEISGIVESSYGYHILLRKELTESQLVTLAGNHVNDLLMAQVDGALEEMTRSEKLDGVDIGDFYTGYVGFVEQLQAANAPEDGASGADDAAGADGAGDSAAE